MKLVKRINSSYQRENPQTHIVEPIPALEIELENPLTEDERLDLEFERLNSHQAYQSVFKKVFPFTNMEEMNTIKSIVEKMKKLEESDKPYFITEGLNCTLAIETNVDKTIVDLKTPQLMTYAREIIAWMHEPQRYVTHPGV